MPATQEVYHVLPDLTALVYALGGFLVALTGLLALLMPIINRLKKDMQQVKTDTAVANTTAAVASKAADAAQQSVSNLGDKVFQIAKDQAPVPPKLEDFQEGKKT